MVLIELIGACDFNCWLDVLKVSSIGYISLTHRIINSILAAKKRHLQQLRYCIFLKHTVVNVTGNPEIIAQTDYPKSWSANGVSAAPSIVNATGAIRRRTRLHSTTRKQLADYFRALVAPACQRLSALTHRLRFDKVPPSTAFSRDAWCHDC